MNGDRSPYMLRYALASTAIPNSTASGAVKPYRQPKFPRTNIERLAQCGCANDVLHEVNVEQFCERMKIFGGVKYLGALRALKDARYLSTGRLLLRHLLSTSTSLPPYIVLEMVEMLVCIYMENAAEAGDEELWRRFLSVIDKVPRFLKPTISLLLKSCCPMNIVPRLPPNLVSRPVVITALLGSYIRYGRTDLFEALLAQEPKYDLSSNVQLLRQLASNTNSHPAISSAYLQCLDRNSVILSDDNVEHFNAIVRHSKYWNVGSASLSGSENCCICGGTFQKNEELSESEFGTLKREIMEYFTNDMRTFSSATDREISNLRKHIRQNMNFSEDGPSLVVDALNVLYTGINKMKTGSTFDEVLQKSLHTFASVLLIVRKGGDTTRIWNKRDRFSDSRLSAFFCHRMSSDDLFILLAVMELGGDAYFLTNDFFLNHRKMLSPSGQTLFDRWVDRRAVRLDGKDIVMPFKFTPNVQAVKNGFHVPVKTVCNSVPSYSFLCVQKNFVR